MAFTVQDYHEHLIECVDELTGGPKGLIDTLRKLDELMLEILYHYNPNKILAFFVPLLRRTKVIELQTLEDELEAALTPDEFRDFLLLDLLVTGKLRDVPESLDIFLAV